MYNDTEIIAEIKLGSPYGFQNKRGFNYLFDLANENPRVDKISIHTNSRWKGSLDLLREARKRTDKPILAKGIHRKNEEIRKAFESFADYALVVGRIPAMPLAEFCYLEPESLAQLRYFRNANKKRRLHYAVWNARDLSTNQPKKESFEEARAIWPGWLCQASYIKSVEDIKQGADAVLVGENLELFLNSF